MTLPSGTKLGRYEIRSIIGVGGMGEVYRASDPKIGRDVAIKVLPADFSADKERVARFEQEAQAAGALNHPNILAIYDVDTQDDVLYVVSELLEGEELRQRLDEGPIPLRKVTEYAQQIVSGLSAAHEKGIVHRDLKPENLFITKDDRVKILDFGLAKLSEPPASAGGTSGNEDATRKALTNPGVVMGTVGYMSPEQVRGQKTDHRSDIFSFGLILYEMITGRRAFQEESLAETMSAIVKEEPPEMTESNPNISPSLERIVRRCLEKKPDLRFQSTADLGFALESLSAPTSTSGNNMPAAVSAIVPETERSPWLVRILAAAASLLLIGCVVLGVMYVRRPVSVAKPVRLFVNPPEKATRFERPRLSPDNRTLAFIAVVEGQRQIWLRPLASSIAKPLAGTENVEGLFWSADSQFIAFTAGGKLNKISLAGGSATTICPAPVGGVSGDWNRDGTIIFSSSGKGITRISATGGSPTDITATDEAQGEISHSWPAFLPDGRHFLYRVGSRDPNKQGIYVSSLDGGEARLVLATDGRAYAVEDPDASGEAYLVFIRDEALLAQPFDVKQNQLKGEPLRLADQLQSADAGIAVTGNMMVFAEGSLDQRLTWVDRTGKTLGTVGPVGTYGLRDISPDDKQVAATRSDVSTRKQDIWLFDVARGTESRFTVDPADDSWPTWSPDGNRIIWMSDRTRKSGLYMKAANGSGQDELLFESVNSKYPMHWSPDGRSLLYREFDAQKRNDLWILPIEGERKPYPWLSTQFDESSWHGFSPDGKWLAYSSNETGRTEIYVQAFVPGEPASGAKWPISTSGGVMPTWRRDGRALYYYDNKGKIMEVDVTLGPKIVAGVPRELFDIAPIRADMTRAWSMTGDGQRFLFVTRAADADLAPFTVVLNWMAELKK